MYLAKLRSETFVVSGRVRASQPIVLAIPVNVKKQYTH